MNEKKTLATKETYALAVQNHKKNNFKVVEKLYKEVLKINPIHVNALSNLGVVFRELGEQERAKSCYKKA